MPTSRPTGGRKNVFYRRYTGSSWTTALNVSNQTTCTNGGSTNCSDRDPSIDIGYGDVVHVSYLQDDGTNVAVAADRVYYAVRPPYTTFASASPLSPRSLLYASDTAAVAQADEHRRVRRRRRSLGSRRVLSGAGNPNNQKLFDYSANAGTLGGRQPESGGCIESLNTRDSYFAGVGTNPAGTDHQVLAEIHSSAYGIFRYPWASGASNFGSTGGTCAAQQTNASATSTGNAGALTNDDAHASIEKHKPTWASDMSYCWYVGYNTRDRPVSARTRSAATPSRA